VERGNQIINLTLVNFTAYRSYGYDRVQELWSQVNFYSLEAERIEENKRRKRRNEALLTFSDFVGGNSWQ
jgi:hypothetical protein